MGRRPEALAKYKFKNYMVTFQNIQIIVKYREHYTYWVTPRCAFKYIYKEMKRRGNKTYMDAYRLYKEMDDIPQDNQRDYEYVISILDNKLKRIEESL